MPRISWSPDGRRVLVCNHNALRIVELETGNLLRELAPHTVPRRAGIAIPTFLDGHWMRDGRIAAIDTFAQPTQFTIHGERYGDSELPPDSWLCGFAAISGDAQTHLVLDHDRLTVYDAGRKHRWQLSERGKWYGVGSGAVLHAALSHDGMRIAISCTMRYRTSAKDDPEYGWLVLDISPQPRELGSFRAPVLGCGGGEATAFAFDRSGKRLAIALPGGAQVYRLAPEPTPRPRRQPGARANDETPRCFALDDRGMRLVCAFSTEPRLRIDYLSPKREGPARVEVVDQQWIDPGLEVVAVGLDEEGNRIACLGADGRVEIVPVP